MPNLRASPFRFLHLFILEVRLNVRTRASSSQGMIRAVAANHVVRKDSMQATSAGVCNRDEGSMVEMAESLMRPRESAIVTRVP